MSVESNGKRTGGVTGKGFMPGQSGNPGGRPKSLAKQAQEYAGGSPNRLFAALLKIVEDPGAKDSDVISASREYLDRGWGKAPAYAPIEGQDPLELTDFDRHISTLVDELARRREAKATGESPNGKMAEGNTGARRPS